MIPSMFMFVVQTNGMLYPLRIQENKLSHYVAVLNPILIQVLLYSLKNTLGSSPLIPLKTKITMLIFILFNKKTHQTN
jgi:hypothetical protein